MSNINQQLEFPWPKSPESFEQELWEEEYWNEQDYLDSLQELVRAEVDKLESKKTA